jgi:hypothetical protein
LVIVFSVHGTVRASSAQPPHRSTTISPSMLRRARRRGLPRRELGGEQLAQGVEAGAARAAQRRRVIAHEASVQQSQLKLTPMWHGQL